MMQKKLPILMYHRICVDKTPIALSRFRLLPSQLKKQLKWLKRHGFYSFSIKEWTYCIENNINIEGKPIILTFDDGYLDFFEHAAPILLDQEFTAHVFIVTDKVGHMADWDAQFGEPAPLMSWDQIKQLDASGISFGSHLASHTAADKLSKESLIDEAKRSKVILEEKLTKKIETLALPFGISNQEIEETLKTVGYSQLFLANREMAFINSNPLHIPRLEVSGLKDFNQFPKLLKEFN